MKLCQFILLTALCVCSSLSNAELVVIVNTQNPTDSISTSTVSKIFLGKLKLFPDGSNAIPLDLPETDDLKESFYKDYIGKTRSQLKSYWAKMIFTGAGSPPKAIDSAEQIVQLVADNPNTIAYVDRSLVNPSVKIVLEKP